MPLMHILLGVCLLSMGVAGITNNWWAVVDFVSVIIPLLMIYFGVISLLAGLSARKEQKERQIKQ
ncbi:MamI-2 [Candidatus Magnetomoraceae bacterium gMMP-15]